MWYTRIAYKPLTKKLLEKKRGVLPFAEEEEVDDPNTPGDVESPVPDLEQVIPEEINADIGTAPIDAPEPAPQSVRPAPNPIKPIAPHDGCKCQQRIETLPSGKMIWNLSGTCEICRNQAMQFNRAQEALFPST